MVRHNIEDLESVLNAATGGNLHAENGLFLRIVHAAVEEEFAAVTRIADGPASEATRDLDDVLLGVSAVNAEGVELEQLAGVVLVETACASGCRCEAAARSESLRGFGV